MAIQETVILFKLREGHLSGAALCRTGHGIIAIYKTKSLIGMVCFFFLIK